MTSRATPARAERVAKLIVSVTAIVIVTALGGALAAVSVSAWGLMEDTPVAVLTTMAIVALFASAGVLVASVLPLARIDRRLAAIPAVIGLLAGICALTVWIVGFR